MVYILFAGYQYYPMGGWDDMVERFATFEEADLKAREVAQRYEWFQIVNVLTGDFVYFDRKDLLDKE